MNPTKEPPKMSDITWRIFRIMAEFVEGFQFLSESEREITIYGSTRLAPGTPWYREAEELGKMLAKGGYAVITGGGPGIMEAANKGASEAGGESIGLNIQLPMEQRVNAYVTRSRAFHYFFTRKVMLEASAQAYVFFPGGYGTLDEFFEMITLIQTGKSERVSMICVGKEFWTPLVDWFRGTMLNRHQTIAKADLDLFQIVDSAKEAFQIIKCSKERTFF
ncbi:TIGR00730 family Rossman fold protein [Candidatus Uhrbacteria bacterium]|nr:TIGR00730 family Rossman fold protein [Candidatus Uhrbacteria bacterium]